MSNLQAEVGLVHGSGFEVINGIQVISEGSQLNAIKAAELLTIGSIERVICSGKGPVQGCAYMTTEAKLMADELIQMGFSHKLIELEEDSTSTVANWANSAPIIEDLGASSVLGITARSSIWRMRKIGEFVAEKSEFAVAAYAPSDVRPRLKDYARELAMLFATDRFIKLNLDTPVNELPEAYEIYKSATGLNTVKDFVHRGIVTQE